ncbi:hypothetical protein Dimus_000871, partial [Dionaea muscipula]
MMVSKDGNWQAILMTLTAASWVMKQDSKNAQGIAAGSGRDNANVHVAMAAASALAVLMRGQPHTAAVQASATTMHKQ